MKYHYNHYQNFDEPYLEDENMDFADTFDESDEPPKNKHPNKNTDSVEDMLFEDTIKRQAVETSEKTDYKELFVRIMEDYHSGNPARQDKAMTDAINALNGIIFLIIRRHYSTYAPNYIADLVQEGKMGILKGLKKYDPEMGMPSTFFHSYIKHEIQTFINENVNKTTAHYSSNIRKINKAIAYFEDKQIPYTIADLVIKTQLSAESIEQALSIRNHANEIHYDGYTDSYLTNTFHSAKIPSPEQSLIENEELSTIQETLINTLTPQELAVVNRWYGLGGCAAMSCKKISKVLDMSVDQVKKAHINALRKLRDSDLKHMFSDQLGVVQLIVDEGEVPVINVERALLDAEDLLTADDI